MSQKSATKTDQFFHDAETLLFFKPQRADGKVNHATCDYQQRPGLAVQYIGRETHQRRDHSTAENSGNHQSRNFIGFVGMTFQRRRINDRKDTRTSEPDQADHRQNGPDFLHEEQDGHKHQRCKNMQPEINRVTHAHQQYRPNNRPESTAYEINTRPYSGLLDRVSAPFDEEFWSYGIHPHIHTDYEDDTQEKQQNVFVAQQSEYRTPRAQPAPYAFPREWAYTSARRPTKA